VYNGVKAELFSNVKVGEEFKIAKFLSTTDKLEIAEMYSKTSISGEAETILTIEIPKNCCNAGKIACYSVYQYEEETLIPPYTSFKLMSRNGNNMHLIVTQDSSKTAFNNCSF
jgi:hypothetical protein